MQFNDELFIFAMHLADVAADISCRYFRQNIVVETKNGNFPVTVADLEIESSLRQIIRNRYPDHTIIGEEYALDIGNCDSGYSWVIDPIDGTTAFTTGKPTFSTLIALTRHDKPVFGIIDQAITKERFVGITDIAAYKSRISVEPSFNSIISTSETVIPESETVIPESETVIPESETVIPESETVIPESETVIPTSETVIPASEAVIPTSETVIPAQAGIHALKDFSRIKSSDIKDLSIARLNATTPYMFTVDEMVRFNQLKEHVKVCAWGGDAYAYAMLASGYIDIIMESQLEYYDVAALIPIITASGGIITTWAGNEITPDFKGQCLASSNLELHNQALKIINN